jgi:hypothetical protein
MELVLVRVIGYAVYAGQLKIIHSISDGCGYKNGMI